MYLKKKHYRDAYTPMCRHGCMNISAPIGFNSIINNIFIQGG